MLIHPTAVAEFDGQQLDIIEINGTSWLRGVQIGAALGLAFPAKAAAKIFRRHKAEFGPDETVVIELDTAGGKQLVRLFSSRGASRIALLANTPKAAEFRDWVLDRLDNFQGGTNPAPLLIEGGTRAMPLPSPDSARLRALASRLLLTAKPWLRRVRQYRQRGLTVAEIALLLGRNKATIRKALRDLETLGLVEPPADLPQRQLAAAHLRRSA
jgi:hypothetical protein